jgi:hypothetical protein
MLTITNKPHRNTILFIAVKAPHVPDGFPAHHQDLKNCASCIQLQLNKYQMLGVQFLAPDDGRENRLKLVEL